jgi:hypothetical protein
MFECAKTLVQLKHGSEAGAEAVPQPDPELQQLNGELLPNLNSAAAAGPGQLPDTLLQMSEPPPLMLHEACAVYLAPAEALPATSALCTLHKVHCE